MSWWGCLRHWIFNAWYYGIVKSVPGDIDRTNTVAFNLYRTICPTWEPLMRLSRKWIVVNVGITVHRTGNPWIVLLIKQISYFCSDGTRLKLYKKNSATNPAGTHNLKDSGCCCLDHRSFQPYVGYMFGFYDDLLNINQAAGAHSCKRMPFAEISLYICGAICQKRVLWRQWCMKYWWK